MNAQEMAVQMRLREALREIAADAERNRWHPDTFHPTELSKSWHDGFISACAKHSLKANAALDPEGAAESDRLWALGTQGTDAEWWQKTGHCGRCGDVGSSCGCEGNCGCADLHGPRLPDWKPDSVLLKDARAALARVDDLADAYEHEAPGRGPSSDSIRAAIRGDQ